MLKPIVKWVGGKGASVRIITERFPLVCETYHEPFVGGGSIFIYLLSTGFQAKEIICSDINQTLIYMYKNVQSEHLAVQAKLDRLFAAYNSSDSKEEYYYEYRSVLNTMSAAVKCSPRGSALFIFLNRTCFRGLYREGPNGFNVPFGNYKKLEPISLAPLSELFRANSIRFEHRDFRQALCNVRAGDFVYLDPPYYPLNSKSFTQYNRGDFKSADHAELFDACKILPCKFLLSNSDVPYVREAFRVMYHYETFSVRRSIHSKNPGSTENEVLISNYSPS